MLVFEFHKNPFLESFNGYCREGSYPSHVCEVTALLSTDAVTGLVLVLVLVGEHVGVLLDDHSILVVIIVEVRHVGGGDGHEGEEGDEGFLKNQQQL